MKKLLSSIHLPTFIFGSIFIFVAGAIGLFVVLNPVQAQNIVDLVRKPFQSVDLTSSSLVEIYREHDTLRFRFVIQPEDRAAFTALSEKLGVGTKWQEGIGLGLEKESMEQISGYLPLKTDVTIVGNEIHLSGGSFNFLASGGVGDEVTFATDGATLRYASGQSTADVFMDEPAMLMNYATASGKLNLSRKIESELFSIAAKIDTIDLHIKGKSIEGKITLK